MLLDPVSFQLVPRAQQVLDLLPDNPYFKLELPASQLEIVTPPRATVSEAAAHLLASRSELARRTEGIVSPAAAAVHPFSSGVGELNELPRYRHTLEHHRPLASRQLVCAFQVHVAVGNADRALAVYNAARSYLPLLAALAATGPFYEGRDTGLASIRPQLCQLLPRQGVPPEIESWEQWAADLAWGEASEAFGPGSWWWELRPHPRWGTLEFRVPDSQPVADWACALAAVIQSLVAWLAERAATGEPLGAAPAWRIAENRSSACQHGVEGQMADLQSGHVRPTRDVLNELLATLEPVAGELECSDELALARALVQRNGAIVLREVASRKGVEALGPWLAGSFLAPHDG